MKWNLSFLRDMMADFASPAHPIAGMEIKDAAIRVARIEKGVLVRDGIALEPGIIEDGMVKDAARLEERLQALHHQLTKRQKEKVPVVLVVPSSIVYSKVFALPPLTGKQKEEAVQLNLQSVSPMPFTEAYSDWEEIASENRDLQIEILSSFARKANIDPYLAALRRAHFVPAAVEFPALAIARAMKTYAVGLDFKEPQVVVNISSDGIDFMVLKQGSVYFEYFMPWKLARTEERASREIPFQDFKDTIIREMKRVSTFYASHWGGSLKHLVLITQALNKEIAEFVEKQFHFPVVQLSLRGFDDVPISWAGVIGAAMRGAMPRSRDTLISLEAVGTERGFFRSQIMSFVELWRNVLVVMGIFFAVVFIGMDSFLAYTAQGVQNQLEAVAQVPGGSEVVTLQADAQKFNTLVQQISNAKNQSVPLAAMLENINTMESGLTLIQESLSTDQHTLFIMARVPSEAAAVDFKNKLTDQGFQNINMPLSKIVTNPDGSVTFSVSFTIPD
ncbi:MAG: pilus assembly protein PilM [Patescibacteria group bacterium]|nr:pilus assembly protein PilM [Patescibacteria group bacterium]